MENQHRHIKAYRELTQQEIDLMNRIKQKGEELMVLQQELTGLLMTELEVKSNAATAACEGTGFTVANGGGEAGIEYRRFTQAEPLRWAAIGKTDIQTGVMALCRAVAQPGGLI